MTACRVNHTFANRQSVSGFCTDRQQGSGPTCECDSAGNQHLILIHDCELQCSATTQFFWRGGMNCDVSNVNVICGGIVSAGDAELILALFERSARDQEISLYLIFVTY